MSDEAKYIAASLRRLDRTIDIIALALARLEQQEAIDAVIREMIEEWSSHLDRFEDGVFKLNQSVLAILKFLGEQTNDPEIRSRTNELYHNAINDRLSGLRRQLKLWQRNLNIWQIQDAESGGNPPIHVTTSIIKAKERLSEIQSEIDYFEKRL